MDRAYSTCIGCGSPYHTHFECHEYRRQFEDDRRRLIELDIEYNDVQPYYLTWEDFCHNAAMESHDEQNHSYYDYETEETSIVGNHQNNYYYEMSQYGFPIKRFHDQYQLPPCKEKPKKIKYKTKEGAQLARIEKKLIVDAVLRLMIRCVNMC